MEKTTVETDSTQSIYSLTTTATHHFNDGWYITRMNANGQRAEQPRAVTLPHDAMIEEERDEKGLNGAGYEAWVGVLADHLGWER